MRQLTPAELAAELIEADRRINNPPSNDPLMSQVWREHQRELEQLLHDLQHGRSDPP